MHLSTFNPAAALVRDILTTPHRRQWTIQGFGMLRTHLQNDVRLHVWSAAHGNGASPIHDHPWKFSSFVVAGRLRNRRYAETSRNEKDEAGALLNVSHGAAAYMRRTIRPGEGLKVIGDDVPVWLNEIDYDLVGERSWYFQRADEIHQSVPEDGTVTIVQRVRGDLPDVAHTYYPAGTEWVSGEPRAATFYEVDAICAMALARWFK